MLAVNPRKLGGMAIWRPTDDTPLTPLRTPFSLLADSVEADLDARGFTRYATKALMDANTTAADGAHATVYADGTPANNGDYVAKSGVWGQPALPFAMAAGVADVSQAGTVIAFPAGRFTQPPIVVPGGGWVSASGAVGNSVIVKYASLSVTSVTLLSTTAATVRGFWTAVQMTPTSAEG